MDSHSHNSLILPPPTNCTGNRRESFLFVFNSIASLCRKFAAGRDGFVISKKPMFFMQECRKLQQRVGN